MIAKKKLNYFVSILVLIINCVLPTLSLDQGLAKIDIGGRQESLVSKFVAGNGLKEDDLIDVIPTVISNVGPIFILRDMVKGYLAEDGLISAVSWMMAGMGIIALTTQQIGMINLEQFSDDTFFPSPTTATTTGQYLNATSQVLGVGVGLMSMSNDLNDVLRTSRCLNHGGSGNYNSNHSDGSLLESMIMMERSSRSSSASQALGRTSSDQNCGPSTLVDHLGNLLCLGLDFVSLVYPDVGPFGAVIQIGRAVFGVFAKKHEDLTTFPGTDGFGL